MSSMTYYFCGLKKCIKKIIFMSFYKYFPPCIHKTIKKCTEKRLWRGSLHCIEYVMAPSLMTFIFTHEGRPNNMNYQVPPHS